MFFVYSLVVLSAIIAETTYDENENEPGQMEYHEFCCWNAMESSVDFLKPC